jgi:Phasin protein
MAKQTKTEAPDKRNAAEPEELDRTPAAETAEAEPQSSVKARRLPATAPADTNPMVAIVEAAVEPEFELLRELGKNGVDAASTASVSLAKGFREFANESASCTREILDCGYAFADELRQAKSLVVAVKVQIDFARSTYVRLLDHFSKMSGLYWSLLSQACDAARTDQAKVKC